MAHDYVRNAQGLERTRRGTGDSARIEPDWSCGVEPGYAGSSDGEMVTAAAAWLTRSLRSAIRVLNWANSIAGDAASVCVAKRRGRVTRAPSY